MPEPFNKKPTECQVCGMAAKYTCPGCQLRTCSLPCIKQHKEKSQCTGERQKIKYKPLSKMDDLDLLNDYRLLEGIGRDVELLRRGALPRARVHPATGAALLRPAQYRLRRAARRRGVRLDFLPDGFQRRAENTSRWQRTDTGGGCMVWRVEWRLPLANAVRVDEGLPDSVRLGEALARHLGGPCGDPAADGALQFYRAAHEARQLRLFLLAERVQSGNRYVEVALSRPLEACLRQRCVIEFPVLIVTTENHAHVYRNDVIPESFFSLCKREEEDKRRAQRSQRRHRGLVCAPADDDDDDRPRKVPRPRLGAVPVVASRLMAHTERTDELCTEQSAGVREPSSTDASFILPMKEDVDDAINGTALQRTGGAGGPFFVGVAPVVKDLEVDSGEIGGTRQAATSAGFGLFGAGDDDDLSD